MIKLGEIQTKARASRVRDYQIEKDYILSWILKGISDHDTLSSCLIFKGGTVLKKVYFNNYRFSEDLDFTVIKPETSNKEILENFEQVFISIHQQSGISLELIAPKSKHENSLSFQLSYNGPLGGSGHNKKVKVDISFDESILFGPQLKNLFIDYSDLKDHSILCYSLEEILIEKMRSIMQRMQPRDFYDIWFLLEQHGMEIEFVWSDFRRKCEAKNINPDDLGEKLEQRLPQYKSKWYSSLSSQIGQLPEFEEVKRAVLRNFRKG